MIKWIKDFLGFFDPKEYKYNAGGDCYLKGGEKIDHTLNPRETYKLDPNLKVEDGDEIQFDSKDEIMSTILSAAWNSKKPVFGTFEDGTLKIKIDEEENNYESGYNLLRL